LNTSLTQLTWVNAQIPTSSAKVSRYLLKAWGLTGQYMVKLEVQVINEKKMIKVKKNSKNQTTSKMTDKHNINNSQYTEQWTWVQTSIFYQDTMRCCNVYRNIYRLRFKVNTFVNNVTLYNEKCLNGTRPIINIFYFLMFEHRIDQHRISH